LLASPTDDTGSAAGTTALEYYQLTVSAALGKKRKTLAVATDTLRDRVVKLIYLNQTDVNISLYPVPSANVAAKVTLHPILSTPLLTGSAYDFTGQATITLTVTPDANNPLINYYYAKAPTYPNNTGFVGYYMIVVNYVVTGGYANFVRLVFPSETYACPHSPSYPDYHSNFQPCIGTGTGTGAALSPINVPGYPCTSFNAITNQCSQCFSGYTLSSNGTCLFNTTCPPRQYYHFGICYPVDASCGGFDLFTGACTNCSDPLKYAVKGVCVPNPALIVNCTSKQAKINNKCVDVSPLCATFNPTTAGCLTCVTGYTLAANATCFLKVVVCGINQYNKNGTCVNFPPNCPNFDAKAQKCLSCAFGYYPNNGGCVKIVCPLGKVPAK